MGSIVRVIAESVRAKGCTIMLTEGRGAEPRLCAVNGIDEGVADSLVTTPCPFMNEALAGNQVVILDIPGDPRTPDSERFQREGDRRAVRTGGPQRANVRRGLAALRPRGQRFPAVFDHYHGHGMPAKKASG